MILILNVGGKLFSTYQDTLTKYPDTLLGKMYSDDNKFKVDEIQFFDRSSKLFEYILNFYRTGILSKPLKIPNDIWVEEILYWGLPEPELIPDIDSSLTELLQVIPDIDSSFKELLQLIKTYKLTGPPGPPGPPGPSGPPGFQH